MDKRDRIVQRIARDLRDGDYVNLGIGMPTLVANCLPPGIEITQVEGNTVQLCAANGGPHDHGNSWAIYGLAVGDTEMTDWRIVKKSQGDEPTLVEPAKTYVLKPGDSHFYDVGVIHSPKRDGLTKLVRVEGRNLDHVQRSNIKAA